MSYLERICSALEEAGVEYALVGGYAVALHGAVRGTIDINIALSWKLDNISRAQDASNGAGLVSQLPFTAEDMYHFRKEYIENRNLIA